MGQIGRRKVREALMGWFSDGEGLLELNLCSGMRANSREGHRGGKSIKDTQADKHSSREICGEMQ